MSIMNVMNAWTILALSEDEVRVHRARRAMGDSTVFAAMRFIAPLLSASTNAPRYPRSGPLNKHSLICFSLQDGEHVMTPSLFEKLSFDGLVDLVRVCSHRKADGRALRTEQSRCCDLRDRADGCFNYQKSANDIGCSCF